LIDYRQTQTTVVFLQSIRYVGVRGRERQIPDVSFQRFYFAGELFCLITHLRLFLFQLLAQLRGYITTTKQSLNADTDRPIDPSNSINYSLAELFQFKNSL